MPQTSGEPRHTLTHIHMLLQAFIGTDFLFVVSGETPVRDRAVVTEQRGVIFASQDMMCCDGQAAAGLDFNRPSQFLFLLVRSRSTFQFHEATVWTGWMLLSKTVFNFKPAVIHWTRRCPGEHACV